MIVLWGANIVDCIMGCEWRARVRQAKRRGVPVVVIDPRRTETAKQLGTEWLPVRPGTDSALMLAVLHVLIREDLVDEAFVAAHATGWEALRRRVLGEGGPATTPEWAEAVCGTPAARIVALARDWARRRPTALVPGLSLQRTWGGEEAVRLAIAIQVATGNLGRLGGSSGGRTWGGLPGPRFEGIPVPPNPVDASVAENDWADAVLKGRAGGYPADIRAAFNAGGNYVAQAADVHKSIRAMQALEFSVCHDLFMTATAKLLRCRPAGHPLARAQRRRVHECELPALLAQGRGGARTGARRLRRLRRPRRADGCRGAVHGGQGRGHVAA